MAYATTNQLATYLGVPVGSLPSNAGTLLERASELIDYATMGRIDTTITYQADAAQKSTCQQVEYWLAFDDINKAVTGETYKSISIGTFSATYDTEKSGTATDLAPRARQTLFLAGMLYRGVRMI